MLKVVLLAVLCITAVLARRCPDCNSPKYGVKMVCGKCVDDRCPAKSMYGLPGGLCSKYKAKGGKSHSSGDSCIAAANEAKAPRSGTAFDCDEGFCTCPGWKAPDLYWLWWDALMDITTQVKDL